MLSGERSDVGAVQDIQIRDTGRNFGNSGMTGCAVQRLHEIGLGDLPGQVV